MIGGFIDEGDHWNCFLLLWDVSTLACAYGVTKNDALQLAWIVEVYLESFKELYGSGTITPKMQHLVYLLKQLNHPVRILISRITNLD